MTRPSVLVNTYVQVSGKPNIDVVSKMFIICEVFVGVVRLPLLGNFFVLTKLFVLYATGLVGLVAYFVYYLKAGWIIEFSFQAILFQYAFLAIFNSISYKRLQRYFEELNVFDKAACCTPKIGKATARNLICVSIMVGYLVVANVLPSFIPSLQRMDYQFMPCITCHILDTLFIGHLLSLIVPRLRLINYYMELSLSNIRFIKTIQAEEFGLKNDNKALCEMEKLLNLYYTLITAYTYLLQAIKWQLLVIIIVSFVSVLLILYDLSYAFIKVGIPLVVILNGLIIFSGVLFPLFSICTIGEQVQTEVRRLRELITARLYENQLDKHSRGMARALLAWTDLKNLSFTLLRMMKIDVSLPIKFMGLLVTYLIILLQFQKVINP